MNTQDNAAAQAEMAGAKMYEMFTRRRMEFRNQIIGESDYPGRGYLIERTLNLEKIVFALHESDYIAARLIDTCSKRIQSRAGADDYLAALELAVFILGLPALPAWANLN
ncbi:hypothetical protein GALL_501420 [mine drainage metagenome]|uniref:Uncharacterized protein n=1 Tax=mine drainage metagenome TaxID=410659 RepID=A0A1J5PSJ4_9ZZZZ